MSLVIDTTAAPIHTIQSFDETDAKNINKKGWSFSYVYNFSEIRDVYVALKQNGFKNLSSFTMYCLSMDLPYIKTPWNKRRILEHLNALKNFELVGPAYEIKSEGFKSGIGEELIAEDLEIFRKIYFSYFRFKELFSWFIELGKAGNVAFTHSLTEKQIINNSNALFTLSAESRFTDYFFEDLVPNPPIYRINQKTSEDLMRFWDVFIKWGTVLKILEKFNLRNIGIKTLTNKNIACTYVIRPLGSFDLYEFLNVNYRDSYIYLPDLVLKLCIKERVTLEQAKEVVLLGYKKHKERLSFERTSEIFIKKNEIKKGDKVFFPKYNDSFVSHIIIRR